MTDTTEKDKKLNQYPESIVLELSQKFSATKRSLSIALKEISDMAARKEL